MLGIKGSPQWKTVTGGSRSYVDRVVAGLPDVRLSSPVLSVRRTGPGVEITTAAGTETFDAAVIAAHPREALAMIAEPTADEVRILGDMPYSVNEIKFHRDPAVLPRSEAARASWNYRLPSCAARPDHVLVSYDLTRLQRLNPDDGGSYIVSLGESELIEPASVLQDLVYEHPQYTPDSVAAQGRLGELGDARLAFAGAYHGWGFHEDGAASGVRAAAQLGREWETPGRQARGAGSRAACGARPMTAAIYRTSIRHVRRDPLENAFTYRSYSWFVDLDDLPVLPRWLRPLAGFHAKDHLGDPAASIRDNVDRFLPPTEKSPTAGRSPCWPTRGCWGRSSIPSACSGATAPTADCAP